jgi:hypothetical protein
MKILDSHWERVRLAFTPTNIRVALFLLSLAAVAIGGAAEDSWA